MRPPPLPANEPTLLIVDDEAALRSSLRRLLVASGFKTEHIAEAETGAFALEMLKGQRFDLAMVDYRMVGIKGTEVLAWLHQHHPDTVRVLMTGYNEEQIAVAGVNEGRVQAYVKKPWDNAALVEMLRALLQEQREARLREAAVRDAMNAAGKFKSPIRRL